MISRPYYIKLFWALVSLKCVFGYQRVSESSCGQLICMSPRRAAPGLWSLGFLRA